MVSSKFGPNPSRAWPTGRPRHLPSWRGCKASPPSPPPPRPPPSSQVLPPSSALTDPSIEHSPLCPHQRTYPCRPSLQTQMCSLDRAGPGAGGLPGRRRGEGRRRAPRQGSSSAGRPSTKLRVCNKLAHFISCCLPSCSGSHYGRL
jgi:hypothetical protein